MAHVFVSYSSKDRDIARSLAQALSRSAIFGVAPHVWWDRADDGLQAGDDYWRRIADALDKADIVIVLWSDSSVASDWVYSEACRAKGRRKIVPVSIVGRLSVAPPMPFDVLHALELSDVAAALPSILTAIEGRLARQPLPLACGRNAAELDQDVLELKRDPMPADVVYGPGDFLKARNQTGFIEFLDGNGSLADFLDWSRRPAAQAQGRSALARLVHAAGGFGKTRLMIELAARLEHEGWLVGFVPRGLIGGAKEPVLQRLIDYGQHAAGLLLIIDYVEQRKADAAWIAERLAARGLESNRRPARLVMLARGVGEWWQSWLDETAPLQRIATLTPPLPGHPATYDVVHLPSTFPSSERINLFEKSVAAFRSRVCKLVPAVAPASDALVSLIEKDPRYARPLAIQMAALLYSYGYDPEVGGADIADLLGKILGLERDHWTRALNLGQEGEHKKEKKVTAISRAAAQSTLCLGVPGRAEMIALIERDPKIALMSDVDVLDVYTFLSRLYPGDNHGIAPIEPDLLGEHHVTTICDDAIVDTCLELAANNQETQRSIFTVLNRASRSEHGSVGEEARRQLVRLVRQRSPEFAEDLIHIAITTPGSLLEEIEKYPTLRTLALREQALLLESNKIISGGVSAMVMLPDGRIASGFWDSTLRLWDAETEKETVCLKVQGGGISALAVLPDGRLASGSLGNTVRLWDFERSTEESRVVDNTGGVTSLVVLGDRRLVSGFVDNSVRIYNIESGILEKLLEGHSGAIRSLAILPNGLVASGSDDQTVRLWDASRRQTVSVLNGHTGSVIALAVLADGQLASASRDRTVRLWDTTSGAEVATLKGHTDSVNALKSLPDGRLASASRDNTIRLWDANSGAETARLEGHRASVNALTVLADGRLAAGYSDSSISLWNPNSGVETSRLEVSFLTGEIAEVLASDLAQMKRRAETLARSASRLSQLGQRERALDEANGAVTIYRKLVGEERDTFLPHLAAALVNCSVYLAGLGRREEALTVSQEASGHYQELVNSRSGSFLPELAASLHNLGTMLSNLGRLEDALKVLLEAVEFRRRLASVRPDTFLPELASSLNNAGAMLSYLGRREEALTASQEAAQIYRALAKDRPDAFLPDLASSLNNLGGHLSALGRREEALTASQEAVDIRSALAKEGPDAFLPDLAMSLNNLGEHLSNLGRREEALTASQEAVDIRRALAKDRPDAFLPDLASSLNNMGAMLSNLGRREEALTASQEAVDIYWELARDRPDAFLPGLASSLINLSRGFSDLGRREEALTASQEAARIYRALAKDRPYAFLPDLASSLGARAQTLLAIGRASEAAECLREGLAVIAPFVEAQPQAFGGLAHALASDYVAACAQADVGPVRPLLDRVSLALGEDELKDAPQEPAPPPSRRRFWLSRLFSRKRDSG